MPPTSPEASEDDSGPISAKSWQSGDQKAEPTSPVGSERSGSDADDKDAATDAATDGPSLPVQKRRRVTRACDECRRKKIKCDGKQPCTHCSVYSYECTYDKPSNRRRNPAPQYIEALESRLQRAESLLRQFVPDVDLADPNLDPAVKQEFRNRERARTQAAKLKQAQMGFESGKEDAQLQSMIESIGQLDLDEKGDWDFHGASSGAVFLRRMKEHFGGMLGPPEKVPFLPRSDRLAGLGDLDSPQSAASSPYGSSSSLPIDLPPKEIARDLCYYSLNCATCLNRIVHLPSFYDSLDKIYSGPLENLGTEGTNFVGLLYAVMALGCRYRALDETKPKKPSQREANHDDGQLYYNAAKRIFPDPNECRDLTSLQGLLFMILFQQATVKLSSCYSTIGIALRSALRMGLHRHLEHDLISPIEQEVRRRVFYVIRQMDIYVSTLLGFPLLLSNEDVDQPYPTEIDDQYIRRDTILPPPPGTPSFFEAFNAHTRLMEILAKIVKFVYPTKNFIQSNTVAESHTTYVISYAKIKQIERDLQDWYERLPEAWRPSTEGPLEAVRIRHLLRFTYAHVQLVLYRPFLHYVSPRLSQGKNVDELSYACAAAAISVSRNIVHIGIEIRKQGVLIGPYWFMLYTEFFAILSLVFYATENPQKPGSAEVLADATAGKNMIANLVDKSIVAQRVTRTLEGLFTELPTKMTLPSGAQIPSKKRTATSEAPTNPALVLQQRRSEEIARNQQRSMSNGFGSQTRASFESLSGGMYPDPTSSSAAFQANLQDLLPLEVSSRRTPDNTRSSAHGYASGTSNDFHSLRKLDALMFPSEDPFAYPNQPMMELGFAHRVEQHAAHGIAASQAETSSFFGMSGPFDDLDPQLMGQVPPFVMQESPGLDLPGSMYPPPMTATTSASSIAGVSAAAGATRGGRGRGAGRAGGQPTEDAAKREQMIRQQERQLEQILAAQRFRGEWGGAFGHGRGSGSGYPGM